jgi:RNA polymerase sigma-70 factor (ECF subfamily)
VATLSQAGRDALLDVPRLASRDAERATERMQLGSLYVENGARIHRFLCDLLGDRTLAADATQETFVRAHRLLGSLDAGARVVPWLFGIARNVSFELRKARFRAARHVAVGVEADAPAPGSPETELLGREALGVVQRALARLSEDRRAMLLMRLDHGLSYDEIAETMGFTLAKTKVEIHRAREVLRAAMAEYEGGAR